MIPDRGIRRQIQASNRVVPGLTCRCAPRGDKVRQMTEPEVPDPAGQENPAGQPGAPGRAGLRARRAADPWQEWLRRAEQLAAGEARGVLSPAWMRKTRGERRWPVTLCVIVAIVLQVLLP